MRFILNLCSASFSTHMCSASFRTCAVPHSEPVHSEPVQCLIQPALTPFLSFMLVQSASNIRRISSSVVDNQLMLFILQRFVPLFPIIAPPPPHTHT